MKKSYQLIVFVLLIISLISATTYLSHADFGDFGGSSDYGGSDWDSSDWGSSSDYDGEGIPLDDPVAIVVIIIFILFMVFIMFKGNKHKPVAPGAAAYDMSKLKNMNEFKEIDPEFSVDAFKEKLSNWYVQMQNCWQNKDLEPLRPYFTDTSFNQFDRQLDHYRNNKHTNRIENICVLSVDLKGWTKDEVNDIIIARMKTRIIDYVVDDMTGNLVKGNKLEKFMDYEWSLIRKSGVLTQTGEGVKVLNCTNCGAPMNVNQSSKCDYCGSVMSTTEYDWVISSIKGISQRTGSK